MLAIGIALSIAAFFVLKHEEEDRARAEFERAADGVAASLDDKFRRNIDLVHSIRDLYAVSNSVERAEFSQFVERATEPIAGVQALEWIPRVSLADRPTTELAAQSDGFSGFVFTERNPDGIIVPAGDRSEYFPVYFASPIRGNEAALGFDLGSNSARATALASARDSGQPVATERVSLVQETGTQSGILVFVPIYVNGTPVRTIEERRKSLSGFALGVFRIGDAIEDPLVHANIGRGIGLKILDISAPSQQQLLYETSDLGLSDNSTSEVAVASFSGDRVVVREFEVAGRTWRLSLSPMSAEFGARMWIPWTGLGGGLLFSSLLAAYGIALQGRTARIEAMVQTRTSELYRANERISESEAEARAITESALDGILTINESGLIGSMNSAAERMFGYESVDMEGKNISLLMPEPDRTQHDSYISNYRKTGIARIIGTGREVTGLRRNGSTFPIDLSVSEMDGDSRRFVGVTRDITVRKQAEQALRDSEERYRNLFENATDLIQIIDANGKYLFTNSAWRTALGYLDDEISNIGFQDVVHPDSVNQFEAILHSVMKGEQPGEIDSVFVTKKGRQIAVRGSISVKMEDGKPVSTQGIFRDVTSRLEVERMKSEFIGIVSHELRTPLTSIRGSLGLMAAGGFGEISGDVTEAIDIAVRNTDRLTRMVGDFLDLERIESGQLPLKFESCEAVDLISEITNNVQSIADQSSVTLISEVECDSIYGDRDRIIQAITNLASNAIKFSPTRGKVTINCRDEDGVTLIAVTDQGRGIPSEMQTAIFDRFRQVTADDHRRRGGIGLGLAIAKGIAESHAGNITVDSRVGEGSHFVISLPTIRAPKAVGSYLNG
ncbi:MAG: PAS domain S-box protein [Chloroflexi bacterium]|nr:PAS domain S-box protein [Chloroflexota bacterium]